MKHTIIKPTLTLISVILVTSLYSQWQTDGTSGFNQYGKTRMTPPPQEIFAIGIGDFTSVTPDAALHVNSNLLNPSTDFNQGEVFRTDAPNVNTFWRMYHGGNEIGAIFALTLNDDFRFQSTQPGSRIIFNTAGPGGGIRERMRIAQGIGFGGIPDVTRVGISYAGTSPSTPIGIPLAMLHLGDDFNIGASVRDWVDVGTLSALNSDHVYFGLKDETVNIPATSDRMDAVINWGNNLTAPPPPTAFGPDNLRFIFTTQLNPGSGDPRTEQDGLEVARMTPVLASTLTAPNFGMMGIGDFSPTGPNTAPADVVDAKLDIDGDLRIRTVANDDALDRVLVIDPNDQNRVHWRDASTFGGGGGGAGNLCSAAPNPLTGDFEVPLNGFTYNFTAPTDEGRVNMGNITCGLNVPVRLFVQESEPFTSSTFHAAILGFTNGSNLPILGESYGTIGLIQNTKSITHAGVYGESINAQNDIFTAERLGIGVFGTASLNTRNFGVVGSVDQPGANLNIGIFGSASGATTNFAGFFSGDVVCTGGGSTCPSDASMKTNVQDLTNATTILNQLEPKTFEFDVANYSSMNLPSGQMMGLIAQDVELIIPGIVKDIVTPVEYDTSGVLINPSFTVKGIKYEALIPLLIAGFNDQTETINLLDSTNQSQQDYINDLEARLSDVEACIQSIGLCPGTVKQSDSGASGDSNDQVNQINIELSDVKSIVLDQNVPNPFAEQTTIAFSIPEEVQKAQMLFYNFSGKLINSIDLDERGEGKINVFANDLSSGVYTYTLIADGKVVATRKMVKRN